MGCCFSRATTKTQNKQQNLNSLKNSQPHLRSSQTKSNPIHHEETPPPPEEESVKEVLSETPISKPNQALVLKPETNTQMPFLQNPSQKFENNGHHHKVPILIPESNTQMAIVQDPSQKFQTKAPIEEVTEVVVSQLSEATTITESFSTATTATTATVTEKREDEATSKQCNRDFTTTTHKWNQSPSRKRPLTGGGSERRVKSPARRPEPSPEKKMKSSSRLVRGRESSPVANRKLNAGSAGVRRESGEGSGRRSRSPSCSRTVGGSGKVSVGGGRKQAPAVENGVEKEKKSESEEVGEKNDIVSQGESIENPHVSMECFIFL